MDNLSCAGENTFEPNATGANVVFLEVSFLSSFSSNMSAYPEAGGCHDDVLSSLDWLFDGETTSFC